MAQHVHLYTYDLFAERVGFKLTWGCLCFYPFFYGIGVWSLTDIHHDISPVHAAAAVACFVAGWVMSRGANNQKYAFKTNPTPTSPFLGIAPRVVPGSRILCSGWWGLARHINYLGEILMAVGLALPGGFPAAGTSSLLPWLYPLYYVALLFPREREDNRVCELKYGQTWRDYCRIVPYRIIPYVY
jgi:delta14-sterol reductase